MENGGSATGEGKDPSSFLSDIIGNAVIVKLNSGVVYKGTSNSTQKAGLERVAMGCERVLGRW